MKEKELFNLWLENACDDPDLIPELKSAEGDEAAVNDMFYRDLEFGTGGLRGVIGAGSNRMNIYTVRRATQGLADYIKERFDGSLSAAIAYDSRIKSDVFAKAAAGVFAANGIKAYIFSELMPTPVLSYAVRKLGCVSGVVVTASHNPSKYNGYKAYGPDGCQLTLEGAERVLENIAKIPMFGGAKTIPFEDGLKNGSVEYIGEDLLSSYLDEVRAQSLNPEICASSGLKVVYTPLNGAGNRPVRAILDRIGISGVTVVSEQEKPDGRFVTCPFPNPEIKEALDLGLRLCEEVKPDLLLATDPDADRVGIAAAADGGYALFSGNEVGAMLLEYICSERTRQGTMPKNPLTVKSIVTTGLVNKIAESYGVETVDVLTGFKFIGEQIGLLEKNGELERYIFGFEESYGYLAGTYARDKDAVVASMLICEMAAHYRSKGITLIQARENMYKKYGVYLHTQKSFTCEGETGMIKMKEIMERLRSVPPSAIGGLKVIRTDDYLKSVKTDVLAGTETEISLPKSDVLTFALEGNASVIIRPSGTEPKIKAYYSATGNSKEEAAALEEKMSADFQKILGF